MAEGRDRSLCLSGCAINGNRGKLWKWHLYLESIWNKHKSKIWTHLAHTQTVWAPAHSTTYNVRIYWPHLQMGNNQREATRELWKKQKISKAREKCKQKPAKNKHPRKKSPKETDEELKQTALHRLNKELETRGSFLKKKKFKKEV